MAEEAWTLLVSGAESRVREACPAASGLDLRAILPGYCAAAGEFCGCCCPAPGKKRRFFRHCSRPHGGEVTRRFVAEPGADKSAQPCRGPQKYDSPAERVENPEQLEEHIAGYRGQLEEQTRKLAVLEKSLQAAAQKYTAAQALAQKFTERQQLENG
ncbi:MAG: hypothetical protein ACLSB9_16795 [Hydrogeniiclostridium mannosilyticum]